MNAVMKRVLFGAFIAATPLTILALGAQTRLRNTGFWEHDLSREIVGIELGFLFIGLGPVTAAVYLLRMATIRHYVQTKLLAIAILVAGLVALWSDNPIFDSSGIDALQSGGFSLWGRVFLSLVSVAVFSRLTRVAMPVVGDSGMSRK